MNPSTHSINFITLSLFITLMFVSNSFSQEYDIIRYDLTAKDIFEMPSKRTYFQSDYPLILGINIDLKTKLNEKELFDVNSLLLVDDASKEYKFTFKPGLKSSQSSLAKLKRINELEELTIFTGINEEFNNGTLYYKGRKVLSIKKLSHSYYSTMVAETN